MSAPQSQTPINEVIVVGELKTDTGRLVLANNAFLSALAAVEGKVNQLEIVTAEDAQVAADLQTKLNTAGGLLEKTRVALTEPFLTKQREIMAAAKGPADRITKAKGALGAKLSAYFEAERVKAAKLEADRQAELARLEKQRLDELAAETKRLQAIADDLAAKKKLADEAAAALAAKSKAPVEDFDFDDAPPAPEAPAAPVVLPPTATEKAIQALRYAPVVTAARPSGVRYNVTLDFTVTNLDALPDAFVLKTAKVAAIKATFCTGWKEGQPLPECDGVTFTVSKTVIPTGR